VSLWVPVIQVVARVEHEMICICYQACWYNSVEKDLVAAAHALQLIMIPRGRGAVAGVVDLHATPFHGRLPVVLGAQLAGFIVEAQVPCFRSSGDVEMCSCTVLHRRAM